MGYIFIFKKENLKLYIIDYYINNRKTYLKINYKNEYFEIRTDYFFNFKFNSLIYKYNVGKKINNIEILAQIKVHNGKTIRKGYEYKCLRCENIGTISESDIKRGRGCNVCCSNPRKIKIGYNDIWTTNPDLAKLLTNPDDGYKYTRCSGQRVDWKCPNCGFIIKNKSISKIFNYGLSCSKCGDGISYPEKFMFNVLQQLNIDFIHQLNKVNRKWCERYKYDFYLPKYEIIIETHGLQHYNGNFYSLGGLDIQKEKKNDKLKKKLAIKNGISSENYIIIDCRYSNIDYIKQNILQSKLANIFDLSNIDWLQCHQFACNSLVKQACDLWNNGIHNTVQIGKIINLSKGTIRKYLKQGNILDWCSYNSKEAQKKNGKLNGVRSSKKVICLNNNKMFNSITEALNYYKINVNHIGDCCKGKRKSAGKDLITKEPLHWMYYNDYLNIKKKECIKTWD